MTSSFVRTWHQGNLKPIRTTLYKEHAKAKPVHRVGKELDIGVATS